MTFLPVVAADPNTASSPTNIELSERGAKTGSVSASIGADERHGANVHAGTAAEDMQDSHPARAQRPRSETWAVYVGKLER